MKFFILLNFLALSAFASERSPIAVERKALNTLDETIELLAAQNLTCKTDKACTTVWYSDRGCGARAFEVTSVNNGNMKELKYLVSQSNKRGEKFGVRANDVECVEFEEFDVKCVEKRCKVIPWTEEEKTL